MSLSFPRAAKKPYSSKEAIIDLLGKEFPLGIKEAFVRLNKIRNEPITYQAVHKIISQLESDGVVEKTGEKYRLSTQWIEEQRQKFSNITNTYGGKTNRFDVDLSGTRKQSFAFDSFSRLCEETARLISSKRLRPTDPKITAVVRWGWWPIKFHFEQLEIMVNLVHNCPNSKHVIQKDTPFGRWIDSQYRKIGGRAPAIGTNVGLDHDLILQGEWIIDIEFSDQTHAWFAKHYPKWKNLNDLFAEFGTKKEPEIHASVTIEKNASLSSFLQKSLEPYLVNA